MYVLAKISAVPATASFGMKNDSMISDCPSDNVVLNEPTPKLVRSESNRLTVTSELVLDSANNTTLTYATLPILNDETGFPC